MNDDTTPGQWLIPVADACKRPFGGISRNGLITMSRTLLAIVTFACLLHVVGCSQRSAVTGTSQSPQGRSTVRIGDKAEYSLNSKASSSVGSSATLRVIGSKRYTVVAGKNHGRSVPSFIVRTYDLREDSEQRIGLMGRSRTIVSWFGEDASGNVYLLGESPDGAEWDVVTDANPPLQMPCAIKEGDSWGYSAHFASGGVETLSFKCLGKEMLKTPAGEYEAYKLSLAMSHTRLGVDMTGYMWVTPSLPLLFELKGEFSTKVSLPAATGNVEQVHVLEDFDLAR